MHTYNPSVSYAASSTKARLQKYGADLIQRHRPKPPLCKGRGTAHGGGGIVKCGTHQSLPCVKGGGPPMPTGDCKNANKEQKRRKHT